MRTSAMVNVSVTSPLLQPNRVASGFRNTLQAYTAPSAICISTAATAMLHLLRSPFIPFVLQLCEERLHQECSHHTRLTSSSPLVASHAARLPRPSQTTRSAAT